MAKKDNTVSINVFNNYIYKKMKSKPFKQINSVIIIQIL